MLYVLGVKDSKYPEPFVLQMAYVYKFELEVVESFFRAQ